MGKETTEQAKAKYSEEETHQTLKKILSDQPLDEDDKGYITRVKEIINYKEKLKAMCISGTKYLLKTNLSKEESDIVTDLKLPREILVIDVKNSKDGVVYRCIYNCEREIQKAVIDRVYKGNK